MIIKPQANESWELVGWFWYDFGGGVGGILVVWFRGYSWWLCGCILVAVYGLVLVVVAWCGLVAWCGCVVAVWLCGCVVVAWCGLVWCIWTEYHSHMVARIETCPRKPEDSPRIVYWLASGKGMPLWTARIPMGIVGCLNACSLKRSNASTLKRLNAQTLKHLNANHLHEKSPPLLSDGLV